MPLLSTLSFHSLSLLISSCSVSAITAKSSAYSNSHGKATLNLQATTTTAMHLTALFQDYPKVSRYEKHKTNLDYTEARDSEWQWHQLGHMQVCTSLQTDRQASIPLLSFLQAGCPSCHQTNSIKALKGECVKKSQSVIFGA